MISAPPESSSKERLLYLDLLRFIAIFFNPVVHSTAPLTLSADKSERLLSLIYLALGMTTIPVLLMISGALLLADARPMSISTLYRKRLPKLIIPLLGWSFFYYTFTIHPGESLLALPLSFLKGFLSVPWSGPLWFLYMLVAVYLLLPFLRPVFAGDTIKPSLACVALILGAQTLDFLMLFFFRQPLNPIFTGTLFSFFVAYFILGNVLIRVQPKIPGGCVTLTIVPLFCAAVMAFGEFLAKTSDFAQPNIFCAFQNPLLAITGTCAFLFFKNWNPSMPRKLTRLVQGLSGVSYGVYLSHMVVLKLLSGEIPLFFRPGHGLDCYTISPLVGPTLCGIATFVIAGPIIAAMKRIPVLRWMVP